ncbi:MAG: hypothetical protein JXR37_36800 [Kiritimatiellae bacterium]|nr:hypothetical protein [Kiritimatiellia bacterium]
MRCAAVRCPAGRGAQLDAVLLLPQTPAVDRAAMDMLVHWIYAPWLNPFRKRTDFSACMDGLFLPRRLP